MNRKDFSTILANPSKIDQDQFEEISSIVKEFPYFQAGKIIFLKILKNTESFKYNKFLKITAAYTTDRAVLFDFITSKTFTQNEISNKIKENHEGLKSISVTEYENFSIHPSIEISDTEFKNQQLEEKLLSIGEPLKFEKGETHSFSQWLNLTKISPINRNFDSEQNLNNDIIDDFIYKKPKFKAIIKTSYQENLAEKSFSDPDNLMTETLARIYLEQKNYSKSIQSYKILSLKYPEKSSLFADQIKAIKKLQEKNKNT